MTDEPPTGPQRKSKRPGLIARFEATRQTYQPALWSRLIAIGAIGLYALVFVVLNTHRVKISFVFASTRVSVIWVILLSLGVGVVLGVLLSQLHRRRQRGR